MFKQSKSIMKLSIITVNKDNALGLEQTFASISKQSSHDFEYIVIDTTAVFSDLNMDMLDMSTSIIFLGIMDSKQL